MTTYLLIYSNAAVYYYLRKILKKTNIIISKNSVNSVFYLLYSTRWYCITIIEVYRHDLFGMSRPRAINTAAAAGAAGALSATGG